MLNLRAASHLSNLAFFSLTSFVSKNARSSRHFVPLEPRMFLFIHLVRFKKMLNLRLDLASSTDSEFLKQRSLLVPLHL